MVLANKETELPQKRRITALTDAVAHKHLAVLRPLIFNRKYF